MKKYPLYEVSACWNQEDYKRNSTSFRVCKKDDSERTDILKWFEKYTENKLKKKGKIELVFLKIEKLGEYSWWNNWFDHKTYNEFSSFEEACDDFRRFLREEIKADFGHYGNEELYTTERHNNKLKYENGNQICLMGAEQEWRWKPCECNDCKESGKHTRIIH